MGTVLAHPKPDSYVNEWVAVRFNPEEGILPVKVLLKETPWAILEAVLGNNVSFIVVINGATTWRINAGDWVVKSPHGKVWYMGESEFNSQFNWRPEA